MTEPLLVDADQFVDSLLAVASVAVLAPLLLGLVPRLGLPQVVLLLAGGVLIGPQSFALADPSVVQPLADIGLGFVFLLAGYEIDQRLHRMDTGRKALLAWLISVALALALVAGLSALGLVRAYGPVAIALTTTAFGTLLPVLRDAGLLRGKLGGYLLAGGAAGELLPILAIAVFLGAANRWVALASLAGVGLVAVLLGIAPRLLGRSGRVSRVVVERQHRTDQLTLRCTILLLVGLLAVTDSVHLDAVLGAFLAGMVLRRWAGEGAPVLEEKLDVVAYGFFGPVFFVYSGMTVDLRSIAEAPLRLLLFAGLLVLVRGLPALLVYRGVLSLRERVQVGLVTATALPLLVALAQIGLRNGTMLPENAAALVGAGVLTVLVLPTIAIALHRPSLTGPSIAPPPPAVG